MIRFLLGLQRGPALLLALVLAVSSAFGAGVLSGRRWFPRVVVQPITREIEKLVPGKTITEKVAVPGPIRTVTRTVTKEVVREIPRYVLVTRPPEGLTGPALEEARRRALRRFDLAMEIPAGQLIPCASPSLVAGGMACGEAVRFSVELLEPSPGVIVPIRIPGEIAQPVTLRVEARPEATAAVGGGPRWYVYPVGFGTARIGAALLTGVSYRGPAPLGSTYEVRAECAREANRPLACGEFRAALLLGWRF